jgi:glycosyltransferase involved in cell wall biosynthesis
MKFYYVDPGLRNNLGHHANSCRLITRELRALGIPCSVFAHTSVEAALREELGARPHFAQLTYWTVDTDPIAGWLTSFLKVATETTHNLRCLPMPATDDIVYLNSAQAAQFLALLQWLTGLPAERRPRAMVEFGTDPGVDFEVIPQGLRVSTRDPRADPRAVMYRFAAGLFPALDLSRLHLFTFEPTSSKLYGYLVKAPVDVLPLPQFADAKIRDRRGATPITVAVLGHQRPDKGYALVPDIAAQMLRQRPNVRLLIHNGAPDEMAQTQQQLRQMAQAHHQITLDERTAGPALWAELLDRSDLILCPYPVHRFAAAYSAVAAEAVASGIPLVVPSRTTLFTLLGRYGGGGIAFGQANPAGIANAVLAAVDRFDELAEKALAGAQKWQQTMGPRNMVKALLAYASVDI